MKTDNIIVKKTFALAVEAVKLSQEIQLNKKEFIISKQFMRSATSIGAMVSEAQYAESKADFIHKLSIALKEAHETEYWLELMLATNFVEINAVAAINDLLRESARMLTTIIKTSKNNSKITSN